MNDLSALSAEQAALIQQRFEMLDQKFARLKLELQQLLQVAALGTSAATIAHEFNGHLTVIINSTTMAQHESDPQRRTESLQRIRTSSEMLRSMCGRLNSLCTSKRADPQRVSARDMADEAAEAQCRNFEKDGISFRNKIDEGVAVWIEPLHLYQVLFNLMANAREAMADQHGGSIVVGAEVTGERATVTVTDTGPGMDASLRERIFEPFASTKSAQSDDRLRCRGLGLALSRMLIEENGGSIRVDSEPDRGTTFVLDLPVAEDVPGRTARTAPRRNGPTKNGAAARN